MSMGVELWSGEHGGAVLHMCRQTNQMLKTYSVMSQRARPRKAAEKGVAAAAAVVREKWGALQHLYNQLQSLPENTAGGKDGSQDEAAAAALDAVMAAASSDHAEPSGSGELKRFNIYYAACWTSPAGQKPRSMQHVERSCFMIGGRVPALAWKVLPEGENGRSS